MIQCLTPSAVTSLGSPAKLLKLGNRALSAPGPASLKSWDATGAIPSRLFCVWHISRAPPQHSGGGRIDHVSARSRGHAPPTQIEALEIRALISACPRPWAFYKSREDGLVPLICPTCQSVFAGFAQSIHASDHLATLHGVVFDILVGSESRVGLTAVFPVDDRSMACQALAREPRARLRPEASAPVRLRFRFAQAAPDTLRQRSPSGCAE